MLAVWILAAQAASGNDGQPVNPSLWKHRRPFRERLVTGRKSAHHSIQGADGFAINRFSSSVQLRTMRRCPPEGSRRSMRKRPSGVTS